MSTSANLRKESDVREPDGRGSEPGELRESVTAVIANDGAPGIDGMRTEELNGHLLKHWPKIHSKLMRGSYVPSPVRRKEIDKPSGGKRMLGIPTVTS